MAIPFEWEVTDDQDWAVKQRQIWLTFAQGGPMAQTIGKLLDVAPPKPYDQVLLEQARKAEQERLRQLKLQAERKTAPTKPATVQRTITGEPAYGPETTVPLATRKAAETQGPTQYPWGTGLPSVEEWRGLPRAIGETAALERGAPSWARKTYEETAAATVAGGPTILGFGAGAEAALPPLRVAAGATLARAGRAGQVLEALPGRAGEVVSPALARFRQMAEEVTPGITRLAREEIGGAKPRVPPPEDIEGLRAEIGETLRAAPKRERPIPTPAAGEGVPSGPSFPPGAGAPPAGGEDPVAKLTQLIKAARKTRPEAEALKHEARLQQAAQLRDVWAAGEGEAGAIRALGTLKGELPKPKFEPPRPEFGQGDIDGLYNRIAEHTFIVRGQPSAFKAVPVQSGLTKLLRGQLPTMGEIQGLEEVFGKEFATAVRSRLPLGNRAWREFWELSGLARGVQAAFDMSYGLRQGIVAAPRHPTAWMNMWKEGFRQFAPVIEIRGWQPLRKLTPYIGEARGAERLAYWEGERAAGNIPQNLFVAEWGPGAAFTEREEVFISRFLDYVPGIRMSNRAFSGMGNELRGRISQGVVNGWRRQGLEITDQMMTDLGKGINYLSGRGPIPDNLGQVLSGIFYAPRFVTSKPAWITLALNPSTSPQVRSMIAQEFVAFVGTGLGILSMVKLSGLGDVEADPRSSDFGKIRLGKLRYDFWGGTQQMARYAAQLITGQRKTIGTGELVNASRQAVLGRFVQSKLSPQAGLGLDVWRGETFMGEDVEVTPGSIKTQAWNRAAPMFIQDVVDAVKIHGASAGIGAPLSFFGAGVQAMWTPGQQVNALTRKYDPQGRSVQEMSAVEFKRLAAEHPDLAAARTKQTEASAAWGSEIAVGKQEQTAEDATFQTQFLERWRDPQGMTRSNFTDALSDYLQARAQRNEVRYAGMDRDPRTDLERRLDEYYGAKLPAVATPTEREQFFARQDALLAADPELALAIKDNQRLIFTDPAMQAVVGQIWDAKQTRKQYYAIPAFVGLSADEADQVTQIVKQASDMATYGQAPSREAAIMLLAGQYPQKFIMYALQAEKLRNPERKIFKMQHAKELSWFSDLPVEGVDTFAMAGVS